MTTQWKKNYLTVIALLIYGLTCFSPLFYPLPPYIHLNIVTVILLTLVWGGPVGVFFVVLVSVVNNNLVTGGGVVIYALLTKVFEILLIAAVNWKKSYTLFRALVTAVMLVLLVKPVNIMLYQCLSNKVSFDANFFIHFKTEYLFFLNHSLQNVIAMALFSCIIAWFILKIFFIRDKKLTFNSFGGIST